MRNFSAEVFAQRFERDVRDELYSSLLAKSMSYHDRQPVGETMARVTNDVREMNLMMNPGVNLIAGANMFLIMPALYAPGIHPDLIVIPLFFILSHIAVQVYFIKRLHPIAQDVRRHFGEMNARLAESLEGLEVVKGAAQEGKEVQTFNGLADLVRDRFIDQGEFEARYLSIFLLGITYAGGLGHAAMLFQAGTIVEDKLWLSWVSSVSFSFPYSSRSFRHRALPPDTPARRAYSKS